MSVSFLSGGAVACRGARHRVSYTILPVLTTEKLPAGRGAAGVPCISGSGRERVNHSGESSLSLGVLFLAMEGRNAAFSAWAHHPRHGTPAMTARASSTAREIMPAMTLSLNAACFLLNRSCSDPAPTEAPRNTAPRWNGGEPAPACLVFQREKAREPPLRTFDSLTLADF